MQSHRWSCVLSVIIGFLALSISIPGSAQTFSDQTAIGVEYTHHVDWSDPIVIGAGAAWGDYDGDGDLDLYAADRIGANALFQNDGGTSFLDVAAGLGVDLVAADSTGALWGDYDNDGDADLYVLNRGDNVLFRNDGSDGGSGWIFTDVTAALGVEGSGRTSTAVWGDYDNDGWLDLYVANHVFDTAIPPAGGLSTHADHLYHSVDDGLGGRVFVDVAEDTFGTAVLYESIAHSVAFFDYDNDGDLDIYLSNEVMGSDPSLFGTILWQNDGSDGAGGWLFTDVAAVTGCYLDTHPMGLAIGDYNNDGWLDIATSDAGPNHLFQNINGLFSEVGSQAGIDRPMVPGETYSQVSWGLVFSDFNLDGIEDLYVATGGLSETATPQPNPIFFNNFDLPNCTFTDSTDTAGANDPRTARGVVRGDYDGDGDEDLYVMNYGAGAVLLRNDQPGGDYLVLNLIGTRSNRDAIGARAQIRTGLDDQYRMVQSGSTTGGSHGPALHFGVPGQTVVDSTRIDWPAGSSTTLSNLAVNQHHEIRELTLTTPTGQLEVDEFGRLHDLESANGNHLNDLRLYFSVDGGAPTLLGPDDFSAVRAVQVVDQQARSRLLSADGRLQIDLRAQIRESGTGQGAGMVVKLTNVSGDTLVVKHYAYYDWNIGDPEGDLAKFVSTTGLRQRDVVAVPGKNFDITTNRPFDHWQFDAAPNLLDSLENAVSAIDLTDGTSPFEGDVTGAVQFDTTLAPGAAWQVLLNLAF